MRWPSSPRKRLLPPQSAELLKWPLSFDKGQSVEVQLGLVSKCGGTCSEWWVQNVMHNKDKRQHQSSLER